MRLALAEAEKALAVQEVPIGCVIVRNCDGHVVARGRNNTVATGDATRHAEFEAIDAALAHADTGAIASDLFDACTLYVTCEPCVMCAAALRYAGFRHVCFGCRNDKFGGCGSALSVHQAPTGGTSFQVEEGVFAEEAIALLRRFYANENVNAPQARKRQRNAPAAAGSESVDAEVEASDVRACVSGGGSESQSAEG